MKPDIPIYLASASPRRKELMTQAGFNFTIFPSTIEEQLPDLVPTRAAEELALQKANDVYRRLKEQEKEYLVIGADTIVCYNDEILGKPKDPQEAFDMLKLLSDRTHQVITGISIIVRRKGAKQVNLFHETTEVTLYPISDDELKAYIETGDSLDKAGAYGIQGAFAVHVREIRGDYNNVVGLPIAKLYQTICGMFS